MGLSYVEACLLALYIGEAHREAMRLCRGSWGYSTVIFCQVGGWSARELLPITRGFLPQIVYHLNFPARGRGYLYRRTVYRMEGEGDIQRVKRFKVRACLLVLLERG